MNTSLYVLQSRVNNIIFVCKPQRTKSCHPNPPGPDDRTSTVSVIHNIESIFATSLQNMRIAGLRATAAEITSQTHAALHIRFPDSHCFIESLKQLQCFNHYNDIIRPFRRNLVERGAGSNIWSFVQLNHKSHRWRKGNWSMLKTFKHFNCLQVDLKKSRIPYLD